MKSRDRFLVPALGLAAVLLSGCATGHVAESPRNHPGSGRVPTPTPPTPTASPSPSCPASGIVFSTGEGDAAMGLRVLPLRATVCGRTPVTVSGYPELRILDAQRVALVVTVHRGSSIASDIRDRAPTTLLLQPGETATSALVWRNTHTDGDPQNGDWLEVTLPGGPAQVTAEKVDLGTTGKADVTAWTR